MILFKYRIIFSNFRLFFTHNKRTLKSDYYEIKIN